MSSIRPFLDSIRGIHQGNQILEKYTASKVASVAERTLLNASNIVEDLVLHQQEILPTDKDALTYIFNMYALNPDQRQQIFRCEILSSASTPEKKEEFLAFLQEIPEERKESFCSYFNQVRSVDLIGYILGRPKKERHLFAQYALPVIANCRGEFDLITALAPEDYCLLMNLRDNPDSVPLAIAHIRNIPTENKDIARKLAEASYSAFGIPHTILSGRYVWLRNITPDQLKMFNTQALPLLPFCELDWGMLFSSLLAAKSTIGPSSIPLIADILKDKSTLSSPRKKLSFLKTLPFIPNASQAFILPLIHGLLQNIERSTPGDLSGDLLEELFKIPGTKEPILSYVRSQLDTLLLPASINSRSFHAEINALTSFATTLPYDLFYEALLLFSFHTQVEPDKKGPILTFLNTLSPKGRSVLGALLKNSNLTNHYSKSLTIFLPLVLLTYRTSPGNEFNTPSIQALEPFVDQLSSSRDSFDDIVVVIEQIPFDNRIRFIEYVTPILRNMSHCYDNRLHCIRTANAIPEGSRIAAASYLSQLFGENTIYGADVAEAVISLPEGDRYLAIRASVTRSPNLTDGIARAENIRACAAQRAAGPATPSYFSEVGASIYNTLSSTLEVRRANLEQRPEEYLAHIAAHGFPGHVRFIGEDGIDAGGLSKEFAHVLCEQLAKKGLFHLTEEGFPSIETEEGKTFFRNWGKFLCALREKNNGRSDKILTGHLFSNVVFEVLKVLSSHQEEKKQQALILFGINSSLGKTTYKPLLTYLGKTELTREANAAMKEILEGLGLEVPETPPPPETAEREETSSPAEAVPPSAEEIQELKKVCLEPFEAMYEKSYTAAESIVEGLDAGFRTYLANSNALEVSKAIQGEAISREKLVESFNLHTDNSIVLQKIEWLKDKILHEPAGSEWVKKFVLAVTGQTSMGPGFAIHVQDTPDETIKSSTCFNKIYIPSTHNASFIDNPALSNKERFFAVLELLVNTSGYDRS